LLNKYNFPLQVKINGSNDEMLRAAAEQFGSKSTEEIIFVARETLEGHQRAIMGTMSVEEIYRDRKTFSNRVFEVASTDLVNMGIMIISYTIKDITDEVGYLAVSSIFLHTQRCGGQASTGYCTHTTRSNERIRYRYSSSSFSP
jgi:hypothetical protein